MDVAYSEAGGAWRRRRLLSGWLEAMLGKGLIGAETYQAAFSHFKLRPGLEEWRVFAERLYWALGSLLLAAAAIFFVAWNWGGMSHFVRFALLEFVLVCAAAWAWLRWEKPAAWDARAALCGAALLIGALLALYGQTYQTGADAWELFRAWGLTLAPLALVGRSTVLWFMFWLTGSLGISLYLLNLGGGLLEAGVSISVVLPQELGILQLLLLALCEALRKLPLPAIQDFDRERVLRRVIGATGILLLTVHTLTQIVLQLSDDHWIPRDAVIPQLASFWLPLYLACLTAILYFYYRRKPDLLLLAFAVFSLAISGASRLIGGLLAESGFEGGFFFLCGVIILGSGIGAARIVLRLRRGIRAGAKAAGVAELSDSALFLAEVELRRALGGWLENTAQVGAAELEAFFQADEKARDEAEPWFSKIFTTLGIWMGSIVILAFLSTTLFFVGSSGSMGVMGLTFCTLAVWVGRREGLLMGHVSRVMWLCGLFYAAGFVSFRIQASALVISLVSLLLWLFCRSLADKSAAFFCFLAGLTVFCNLPGGFLSRFHSFYAFFVYDTLFCIAVLYALHEFCGDEAGKARPVAGSAYISPPELRRGAARAVLIFFSLALLLFSAGRSEWLSGDVSAFLGMFSAGYTRTLPLVLLTAGLLLWLRRPAARPLLLAGGAVLPLAAFFMPAAAAGLGLVFLARRRGHGALLGLAVFYLGTAVFLYYYNLNISLADKSRLLAIAGALLCLAAFALRRLRQGNERGGPASSSEA